MGHYAIARIATIIVAMQFILWGCNTSEKSSMKSSTNDFPSVSKSEQASPMVNDVSTAVSGKQPRIAKIAVLPLTPRKDDVLEVQATADDDGGGTVDFRCQWSVNQDTLNDETGLRLKYSFKRNDKVTVIVTPEREGVQGRPLAMQVTIGNSPPVVSATLVDVQVKGLTYSGRILAQDPDGGELAYTLLKGPRDMVLDSRTGLITGVYQQSEAGQQMLSVSVKDSEKAEVIIEISFQLGFGK